MGAPRGNKNAAGPHKKGWYKGSGSKRFLKNKRKGWYRFSLGRNVSGFLKGQSRNRQWQESIVSLNPTKLRKR